MPKRCKGGAIVETALMMPWLFFLFIGVLDAGFYTYAAICTQNAARAAAMKTSGDTSAITNAIACTAALGEMTRLPNARNLLTCATSPSAVSDSQPVAVSVRSLNRTTSPACADCAQDVSAISAQVTVTYRSIPMIPIPGIMMGRMDLTRIAEARVQQ